LMAFFASGIDGLLDLRIVSPRITPSAFPYKVRLF
jgi:hypothetical protein